MSAEGICQHFNPRTPCGVRRLVAYRNRPTHNFNPRTPCGVRLTGPALPSRALLFQSTHPLRGATPPRSPGSAAMSNFNPRTPCGVRPMRRGDRQQKQGDFNPRTPCGVRRHDVQQTVQVFLFQSTHPLRGATQDVQHTKDSNPFQSTHPLRGATTVGAQAVFTDGFQSTHPLRGATRPTRVMLPFVRRNFNPRTPCGVRRRLYNNPWAVFKFQSTHPLRGATAGSDARPGTVDISIHAPLAGCDSVDQRHGLGAAISIHAPLAGCDTVSILFMPRVTYFNPRTPCGVRPAAHQHHRGNRRISIHAPLAGCDWLQPDWVFDTNISIHAPLAGCDTAQRIKEAIKAISIHAPLAVCDWREAYQRYLGFYFNPRTPCGVRPF